MKKLLLLCFAVIGATAYAQTKTEIENVDAATFKKYMEAKKGPVIDLRTNDELKSKGMIKGATQIDFLSKNAEETIKKLDHNKTYLIYCAGGGRSSDCAELMKSEGFTHVVNLAKGFDDWKKKGFETVAAPNK